MTSGSRIGATLGAIVIAFVSYFSVMAVAVPAIEMIFDFMGRWFYAARFGGAEESNHGLIKTLLMAAVYSGICAQAAYRASGALFGKTANHKATAMVLMLATMAWFLLLVFIAVNVRPDGYDILMILATAVAMAGPPLYACNSLWKEGWR
ncbi:MAG: hypothetical protein ACRC02_01830 [Vogesella sp.]|uniref:hypothetical protein n=1 Tax=Vogesella sp. TaxID=1904252 RepID=UPI003F3B1A5E